MAARGRNSQLGLGEETTFGTPVTPTRFLPYSSETLNGEIERTESTGLRADAGDLDDEGSWVPGKRNIAGDLNLEVPTKGFGLPLLHALGDVVTTNSGTVYEHKFTLGSLAGKGLTCQVGFADGAAAYSKTAGGCKVASWELGAQVGDPVHAKFSLLGTSWAVDTAKAVPSYPAGLRSLSWSDATVKIGGTSRRLESVTFSGDNALDADDYAIGSLDRAEPVDGKRGITGEASGNFVGWADYQRFLDGTMATLELTALGPEIVPGTRYGLVITANVRTDGDAPQIGGPERIKQPLKFRVLQGASLGFDVVYRTTDVLP